jgi:hypothetical protein
MCVLASQLTIGILFVDENAAMFKKLLGLMVQGSAAGFVATVPMTLAMEFMYRRLPMFQRYPLPPSRIISRIFGRREQTEHRNLTFIGHFAFGAMAGAGYAVLFKRVPVWTVVKGLLFGTSVWFVSYEGWLPTLRILPSASETPKQRNLLMIAAHLVWGSVTAMLVDRLSKPQEM